MENIKRWLLDKGATSLWDLSAWEDNIWKGWDLGDLSPELEAEAEILTAFLQGKSPLREGDRDRRGWGSKSGNYSALEGYENLQEIPYVVPNPVVWKYLWSRTFVPKIDLFL